MSLGTWTAGPQSFSFFDVPFFSVGPSTTDMSGWHWLMPTKFSFDVQDYTYHLGNLFNAILEMSGDQPDAEDAEMLEGLTQMLGAMETYGLASPSIDLAFDWGWDAEAGPATLYMQTGLDGYGTLTLEMAGESAEFAAYAALLESVEDIEDSAERGEAFEKFWNRTTKFSSFTLTLDDQGGLDKIFPLVIDLAKASPPDSDLAPIAGFTPENFRLLAVSGVVAAAGPLAGEFPQMLDYANAFSGYLRDGGRFVAKMQPETPISLKEFLKLSETLDDPATLPDLLGVTVTHEPPIAVEE